MKKIYRRALLSALLLALCVNSKAQIGYQVALLNAATGEPRAGETVSVDVTLSDKNGKTIYNQKQSATANDFGILSLSVGNANMFDGVDWNTALPLSISVTADNKLVAKSQVLHVPVAEYAKQAGTVLTEDMLLGTWTFDGNTTGDWHEYIFEKGGKVTYITPTCHTTYYYNTRTSYDGYIYYDYSHQELIETGIHKSYGTYEIISNGHVFLDIEDTWISSTYSDNVGGAMNPPSTSKRYYHPHVSEWFYSPRRQSIIYDSERVTHIKN